MPHFLHHLAIDSTDILAASSWARRRRLGALASTFALGGLIAGLGAWLSVYVPKSGPRSSTLAARIDLSEPGDPVLSPGTGSSAGSASRFAVPVPATLPATTPIAPAPRELAPVSEPAQAPLTPVPAPFNIGAPMPNGEGQAHHRPNHGHGLGRHESPVGHSTQHGHGVQADPMGAYRVLLAQWFQARKRYPGAARRQGRQGEVHLFLVLEPHGQLVQVQVEQSSGHETLDQAALSLVRNSGPLPAPPQGMRTIRVAIAYSLT